MLDCFSQQQQKNHTQKKRNGLSAKMEHNQFFKPNLRYSFEIVKRRLPRKKKLVQWQQSSGAHVFPFSSNAVYKWPLKPPSIYDFRSKTHKILPLIDETT